MLGILWWSWVGYAWLTSVVDPEEGAVRIVMFAAMAGLLVDGPSALAWARNRSVHPPKRGKDGKPDWASWEVIYEAWRLALEYTDLVLLRLLGPSSAAHGRFRERHGPKVQVNGLRDARKPGNA